MYCSFACEHSDVAEDSTCTECGDIVYVVVSNADELNAAIKNGAFVKLSDSAEIEAISIPSDTVITIDLNGKSIDKKSLRCTMYTDSNHGR